MGLAKSASTGETTSKPVSHVDTSPLLQFNEVPMEMINYFGFNLQDLNHDVTEKMKDIYSILSKEHKDMGDLLRHISGIEMHLGSGGYTNKFNKVWNYIKITERISDLEKQRESMRA